MSSAVDASLDSDIITHPNLEYFTTLKLGRKCCISYDSYNGTGSGFSVCVCGLICPGPLFIQGALAAQNATDLATLITITEPEANIFKVSEMKNDCKHAIRHY